MGTFKGFLKVSILLVLFFLPAFAMGEELDVSELIGGMKRAIIEAQKTAKEPLMDLPWIEGEISYVVKKEGGGGFRLYVVTAEGKYATEAVHRVKFRLEPPKGTKWRVQGPPSEAITADVAGVDLAAQKLFISPIDEPDVIYSLKVMPNTKISDINGLRKTLEDIRAGTKVKVYSSPSEKTLPVPKSLLIIE